MTRCCVAVVCGLLSAGLARAQFTGLSTNYDGSKVYFASSLKLRDSDQPNHGKLFVADVDGVRLFRSRAESLLPQPPVGQCDSAGSLFDYRGAEVSADGRTLALAMTRNARACSFAAWTLGTSVVRSASPDADLIEVVRISSDGNYGIGFTARALRPIALTISLIDFRTGGRTPVTIPQDFPNYAENPWGRMGRAIANNGDAIVNRRDSDAYIVHFDRPSAPFPRPNATLLAISADGDRIAFRLPSAIYVHQRSTAQDQLIDSVSSNALVDAALSDDGQRMLYLVNDALRFHDGVGARLLESGITTAALSGNGEIAYAATKDARLLKLRTGSGLMEEFIPRSPFVARQQQVWTSTGGLVTTVPVAGFDSQMSVEVNGKPAPVFNISPTELRFFVPWDAPAETFVRVIKPKDSPSPFDGPEFPIRIDNFPRLGSVVHQDWSGPVTRDKPARAGDIVHVFAVGLGPASPEVPLGEAAPSAEPFARLSTRLTCTGHEVLYAGLAPLHRERIYQIDLKLGINMFTPVTCTAASVKDPLVFTIPSP